MISVGFCWNWAAASSIGPLRQFGFFMGTCITATQLHSDLRMGWNHFTPNYIILYLGVLTVLTSIYRLIQVVQAILMFTRVPGFWCIATWFWPSCLDQNANHTAAQRWFAWWVQMVLDVPSLDDHQEAYLLWVGSKHVQNAIGAEVNWVIVATLYPLVLVNHERSIAGWAYRLFRRWSGYASNFGKVQRGWTLTPVHDIFRAIHMRGACRIRPTTVGNMSSLAPFALAGGPGCTQTSQEGSGLGLEQTALSDGVMAWQREIMGHIWSQRVESHHVTAFSRRHAHHGIAMVKSSWWFSIQDVDVQDEDGRCWATRDGEGPRDVRRTMFFFSSRFHEVTCYTKFHLFSLHHVLELGWKQQRVTSIPQVQDASSFQEKALPLQQPGNGRCQAGLKVMEIHSCEGFNHFRCQDMFWMYWRVQIVTYQRPIPKWNWPKSKWKVQRPETTRRGREQR